MPFTNPQKTPLFCRGRSARMSSGRHRQVSLTCWAAVNTGARAGGAVAPFADMAGSFRRGGARVSRRVSQFCGQPARAVSARGVRRCRRDRPRASCGAGSGRPRWPPDTCVSGDRGGARRGGRRCFRRCTAPRSGAPTSSPTSEAPSFLELPHGRLWAGRRGANVCRRLASNGSFVPSRVSPQDERKRHGEDCDCGAMAWRPLGKRLARRVTSRPMPSPTGTMTAGSCSTCGRTRGCGEQDW